MCQVITSDGKHEVKYSLDAEKINHILSQQCDHKLNSCFTNFSVVDVRGIRNFMCHREDGKGGMRQNNESEIYESLIAFLKNHIVETKGKLN